MSVTKAEIRLPTHDVHEDIAFFTETLRMRMDMIFPADDPQVVVFSGYGVRLRIEKGASEPPGTIRILCPDPKQFAHGQERLIAPNGLVVEIDRADPPLQLPEPVHAFEVRRLEDRDPWIIGRAGMHYRDLVPSRLGGAIIASHIRIPKGGPVPDLVHFHKVGFQLIFCIHGWVDVIYEDQGGIRRLTPGDCFIQPPEIRHRVMEASDDCQVIEIGVPSDHVTEIDHDMELPTPDLRPHREWDGQKFVHNRAETAEWNESVWPGFVNRDTTISENTGGTASVHVFRTGIVASSWLTHDAEIYFSYVMRGTVLLESEGQDTQALTTGDAFVIPPGMPFCLERSSQDFEFLEVALPGTFVRRIER